MAISLDIMPMLKGISTKWSQHDRQITLPESLTIPNPQTDSVDNTVTSGVNMTGWASQNLHAAYI